MPVFSYLAYPVTGEKDKLFNDLSILEHCEVIRSDKEDVLILVTDTPDESTEKKLQKQFSTLPSLQSLSMTFGHTDVD